MKLKLKVRETIMESKYKRRIILIRVTKISIILKINKFNLLNSEYIEETKIKYFYILAKL